MRWGSFGRIVPLALAACLAAGLPAVAEDAAAPTTGHGVSAPQPKVEVSIPTVQAVNSSIDEATLRAIFMGDLVSHAAELATLKAQSIRVPELRIDYVTPAVEDVTESGTIVLRDIRLMRVAGGVAQAIIIGSAETNSTKGGTAKFGKMSAEDFDIGGLLAFVGLVKGDPAAPRKTLYRKFLTNGGTAKAPKADCTFGPSSVDRVSVRPLKVPFTDMFALLRKADKDNAKPSKEEIATMVDFFVDVFDAIQISPMKLGGFSCSGTDDDGKPVAVKFGGMNVGAFARGRYPDFLVRDIAIATEGDGQISLGEFRFKGFDMSGPLATLKAAAGAIDEQWLQENYRALIPSFDGFGFAKFALDIDDPENPGERVKASVAKFDLTLKGYVNAIPTDIATSASHIVAVLPATSSDSSVQKLLDYGIDKFDLGFDVGLKWNEAASEIRIDRFSVTGADMGSVAAATVIGGATRDLFSGDTTKALETALGLTLKRAKIDIRDAGLADVILQAAAKGEHQDVATFRKALAAFAQGTILLFLGPAGDTEKIATAIGDFVNGKRLLSVTATAKDPAGVTFDELQALSEDPTGLFEKLDIDAAAR